MHTVSISFTAVLFVALLFLLAAFVLARLLRSLLGANGAIWLTLAGLVLFGMLLLAMFRVGISVPQPVEIVTPMPQLGVAESRIHVATQAPLPPVVEAPQAPDQSPSIEEMWKQLTASRINLDETVVEESVDVVDEAIGPSSPQELHAAAKVILSASVPGADPFTQGWLVNAAKSILDGRAVPPPPAAPEAPAAAASLHVVQAPVEQVIEIDGKLVVPGAPLPDKPEWLVTPPKQVGNVRRIVVASGPFSTVEECQRDLDRKMYDVVRNRMIDLSRSSLAQRNAPAELADVGLGGDYIRRELCTDEFVDTVDSSVGEMKQVHALLEFNEAQDAMLIDRARTYSRHQGLRNVSLIGGGLLASVATLFGLLKVDTWTRGYYTKRLFLGVPAAIITVLALLTS